MIQVPISAGELFDKLSILRIKMAKINDLVKLDSILKENTILLEIAKPYLAIPSVYDIFLSLLATNFSLWEIEDRIREKEALKEFDEEFIGLARKVYVTNDIRFERKSQINILLNSEIVEVKEYKEYK